MSGCCGQKRQLFRARRTDASPASSVVQLRYLGRSTMVLWGTVTGQRYEFSTAHSTVPVDTRDAVTLLASGLFSRV